MNENKENFQEYNIKREKGDNIYIKFFLILVLFLTSIASILQINKLNFTNKVNVKNGNNLNSNISKNNELCTDDKIYKNQTDIFTNQEFITDENTKFKILALINPKSFASSLNIEGDSFVVKLNNNYDLAGIFATSNELKTVSIYLYNFDTKKTELLVQRETINLDFRDKTDGLKDFSFLNTSNDLLITTSTGAFIYDIETKESKKLFDLTEKDSNVFSYSNPLINYHDTNAILSERYYEGSTFINFDLVLNKLSKTDFGGYNMGSNIIGWYKNNLIIEKYGFSNDENINGIYLADFNNLSNMKNLYINESPYLSIQHVQGNHVYFSDTKEGVKTGLFNCTNNLAYEEVFANINYLYKLNLDTKEVSQIAKFDMTTNLQNSHRDNVKSVKSIKIDNIEYLIVNTVSNTNRGNNLNIDKINYQTYITNAAEPLKFYKLVLE